MSKREGQDDTDIIRDKENSLPTGVKSLVTNNNLVHIVCPSHIVIQVNIVHDVYTNVTDLYSICCVHIKICMLKLL